MEYKDAIGVEIEVGDHIVYSTGGALQLGKVLELTTIKVKDYSKPLPIPKGVALYEHRYKYEKKAIPSIKIQGARREWRTPGEFKKMNPSFITKFESVLVLNQNLAVTMTLI